MFFKTSSYGVLVHCQVSILLAPDTKVTAFRKVNGCLYLVFDYTSSQGSLTNLRLTDILISLVGFHT